MAPERNPKQAGHHDEQSTRDDPPYMGKTIAVLCYGFSAFAALVGLTLIWLAVRSHYQGPQASVSLRDTIPLLAICGALSLILAGVLFIWPTLMAQHPKLRLENQYAHSKTNALEKQALDRSKMAEAIKQAPESLRRRLKFWRWTPLFGFTVLMCLHALHSRGMLPGSMVWIGNALAWIDQTVGMMSLIFVIVFLNTIPIWLLRREALRLHNRNLARSGDAPDACPDCGYPVDQGIESMICPECGFDRSPAGAETA